MSETNYINDIFSEVRAASKSKLFQSVSVYTLANAINSAIPFFLLPILTRYLNTVDYGIVATFQVLVGFVTPFTGLNIQGAIARKYFDKDEIDLPTYIGNCFLILLFSTSVVSLVLLIWGDPICRIAVFPKNWLWSVILTSTGSFITLIILTLWQVQTKPLHYGMFQTFVTLLNICFSLWFVVWLGLNWQGRIWGQVIAVVIAGGIGFFILFVTGWIKFKIDYSYIVSAIKFGIPLIPHAFGGWVITFTDRVFINNMVSVAETGIYTVAYQITLIIALLEISFNNAWVPWLYEKLGENNPNLNLRIVKFTYLYVFAILCISLILTLFSPWILNIFVGKDFRSAGPFIFWLAMSKAINAMYYMTCNYIFYVSKTAYIALATVVASLVNVLFTYFLIKTNGSIGAAQATVISSLTLVSLVWWFASRLHKMPWIFWRKTWNT